MHDPFDTEWKGRRARALAGPSKAPASPTYEWACRRLSRAWAMEQRLVNADRYRPETWYRDDALRRRA